jgi:hypothetical protein
MPRTDRTIGEKSIGSSTWETDIAMDTGAVIHALPSARALTTTELASYARIRLEGVDLNS